MPTVFKKASPDRVEVLNDIPEAQVDRIVADFESSGAVSLTKEKQLDGRWRVIAKFD